MTKTRWMLLVVGVIALGMVAHVVIAADEEEGPRRRPRFRPAPRRGGERPEGRLRPGGPGGEGAEGGRRPMFRRIGMVSPLMAALDKNKDGALDAAEIKNASKALAKLDKNRDGKITAIELRPPRPQLRRGPGVEGGEAKGGEGKGPGPGGRRRRRPGAEGGPRRGGEGRRRPRPEPEE